MGAPTRAVTFVVALAAVVVDGCVPPAPPPQTAGDLPVALPVAPKAMQSFGTQAAGRGSCSSIMLIPGEQQSAEQPPIREDFLALLEGHLMSRGLNITSSAWTGTVVSDPTHQQVEGAAKLSLLERALVLAKRRSNVDCVFQIFSLDLNRQQARRYFVLHPGQAVMVEESAAQADPFPVSRKRILIGPLWEIQGKVIAVENGNVLAIVGFRASTVDRPRKYTLKLNEGMLQPSWNADVDLTGEEEVSVLRTLFMDQLAREIRGPVIFHGVPGPGDLRPPSE